ncbi:MAG: regulatory protein RecX [Actinobacteria bacterium]|nr:regulatory protein RecX [Actinomycetota bacterium]
MRRRQPQHRGAGVITSIATKRSRSDRVAVRLDGMPAFDVASGVAEEAGLKVGDRLSEEDQERLLRLDAPYRAREKALSLLSLRDRSRREVQTRLKSAGFEEEVILEVITWLEGLDYLDDGRFTTGFVVEKQRAGWGPQRIRAELLRKGVERSLVEEGLSSEKHGDAAAEGMETAIALARRRFGRQFREDPASASRRLAAFLARRGYDWDSINTITRLLVTEAEGECETV